jgi:hypothetical protein
MHRRRVCAVVGVPFFLLSAVSVLGQGAQPPQVRVETLYPRHAAPGRTTVINVAIPSADAVDAAEVSPSAGVTVSGVKGIGSGSEQNIGWWEVSLDVARDAAPGDRSLVLVMRKGVRTAPATISVPTHGPTISDLKVVPTRPNQPALELQLAAADAAGDLGNEPYVWFMADCGGEPIVGALRGRMSAGTVRTALPDLRAAHVGDAPADRCDVQVRVTDTTGLESNTLKTAVELKK